MLILADFFKCDYRFFVSNERLTASEQTESLYRRYGTEFRKSDRRAVLEFLYLCECEQMLQEALDVPKRSFSFIPAGTYFKGHAALAAEKLGLTSPIRRMRFRVTCTRIFERSDFMFFGADLRIPISPE